MPHRFSQVAGHGPVRPQHLWSVMLVLAICWPQVGHTAPARVTTSPPVSPAPATGTDSDKHRSTAVMTDPYRYFVTQFRSECNLREPAGNNGNCGPSCVVMAAMAFGRLTGSPATASRLVQTVRLEATGRVDAGEATSVEQLAKGAQHYGFVATPARHSSMAALTACVQAGGMGICCVKPGLFDPSYRSAGHYVLVTAIDVAGVHISDPGRSLVYGGIRTVPGTPFNRAWQAINGNAVYLAPTPV
ncbi:MAG: C39 family peptidase [Candidatus Sericytochromatia bacterium]|nr:C39 family peptidase [Candidatus Sericytochromatia bacterium]